MWKDRHPTYYIEVKATDGPHERPFFCSQSQVHLMGEMRPVSVEGSDKVYLIVRVSTLGGMFGTGLKIYLDPATLRRNGELEFKTDKYAVTEPVRFTH